MGFSGFSSRAEATPIPNLFFSEVLPDIKDITELRVALHVFWSIHRKKGYPRFVTYDELASDKSLTSGLTQDGRDVDKELERGLKLATERGLLLVVDMESLGRHHKLIFINDPSNRKAVEKIRRGELNVGALPVQEPTILKPISNIFKTYEDNIGPITPLIADQLKEAEQVYPTDWIAEAVDLAVTNNKRRWSYIEAILRRWQSEGKDSGADRGRPKTPEDSEKFFRNRFGKPLHKRG